MTDPSSMRSIEQISIAFLPFFSILTKIGLLDIFVLLHSDFTDNLHSLAIEWSCWAQFSLADPHGQVEFEIILCGPTKS